MQVDSAGDLVTAADARSADDPEDGQIFRQPGIVIEIAAAVSPSRW
jgi:hypothetical protein